MNIIDIVILIIMSISMIVGLYNGMILSALHAASFFLSWLASVIFYPYITKLILDLFPSLLNVIVLYAEGSTHIPSVERMTELNFISEMISEIADRPTCNFRQNINIHFSQTLEGIALKRVF